MQNNIKYVRLTIVIVLTLVFSLNSKAQEDRDFVFELQFSPYISWLKSENTDITSGGIKAAFSYGLTFNYNFASNYSLYAGLNISHNRGLFEDRITEVDSSGNTTYSSEEKFRLNYIDLPVGLKLKSNEIGYLTYWGKFGIAPGFRIKARDTFKNPFMGVEIDNENIIKEGNAAMIKSNFLNLTLNVSAGIDYAISGNTKLFAGLIFNNGFLNVLDDNDGEKTVLRSLGIQAGLIF